MENFKYEKLKEAVEDLLMELGIGSSELITMSKGYSPSYLGKPNNTKVQLSKFVAEKLVDCGVGAIEGEVAVAHKSKLEKLLGLD